MALRTFWGSTAPVEREVAKAKLPHGGRTSTVTEAIDDESATSRDPHRLLTLTEQRDLQKVLSAI